MGFYKTISMLGVILGVNIAVWLLNIPIANDLLVGNHLIEASTALAITTLLIDLRLLNGEIKNNYFKIGLIAFGVGTIWAVAGFSSLFIMGNAIEVITEWIKIAPIMIACVGLPSLYIADKLSQKNKIFGMENTGNRGRLNILAISTGYTILALWALMKWGILKI